MTHIDGSYADREKEMWECLLKKGSVVAKWRLRQAEQTLYYFIRSGVPLKIHRRYPEMCRGGE